MTELDFTILAIVTRDGPMSAYDVRKVFAASLTPTWSSSTGSVYPAIQRLEATGLVVLSQPLGARSRRNLSVTPDGKAALEAWLLEITPEIAGPTADRIRTRMFFLTLMDGRRRAAMVAKAIDSTSQALADTKRRRAARGDRDELQKLATEGAIYELRARLEWLTWLEDQLGLDSPRTERPDKGARK